MGDAMAYTYFSNIVNHVLSGITQYKVSSLFGKRTYTIGGKTVTDFHSGIDFPIQSSVIAFERGKVIEVVDGILESQTPNIIADETKSLYSGNMVKLQHGSNAQSVYYHLKSGSVKVKVGDVVEKGHVLGTSGKTGYSTGIHLHFGIKIGTSWQNPLPYLQGTKTLNPYQDPSTTVIDYPGNAKLLVLIPNLNYRSAAGINGTQLGTLQQNKAYALIGTTPDVDGYLWAQIKVENKCVYAAIDQKWNTIITPEPVVIIKEVESPIDATITDGSITAHITRK